MTDDATELTPAQRRQRHELARQLCSQRYVTIEHYGERRQLAGGGPHQPVLTRGLRWTWRGPRRVLYWTCWFCNELREPLTTEEQS